MLRYIAFSPQLFHVAGLDLLGVKVSWYRFKFWCFLQRVCAREAVVVAEFRTQQKTRPLAFPPTASDGICWGSRWRRAPPSLHDQAALEDGWSQNRSFLCWSQFWNVSSWRLSPRALSSPGTTRETYKVQTSPSVRFRLHWPFLA